MAAYDKDYPKPKQVPAKIGEPMSRPLPDIADSVTEAKDAAVKTLGNADATLAMLQSYAPRVQATWNAVDGILGDVKAVTAFVVAILGIKKP